MEDKIGIKKTRISSEYYELDVCVSKNIHNRLEISREKWKFSDYINIYEMTVKDA